MTIDISSAVCDVLNTSSPMDKAIKAQRVYNDWISGKLTNNFSQLPPLRPARPNKPDLLLPSEMPRRRKAGSLSNKVALLHAIAHIELNAIDLAFDIIARFGAQMPKEFIDDWLKVGYEEAEHFSLLNQRLQELESFYGALPAHDGLWESAINTHHDLAARLAVVPLVLEARGLDVTPGMITQFKGRGDTAEVDILTQIYDEEITHVATGKRWFSWLAQKNSHDEQELFQTLVKEYFAGKLKRPFNVEAREKAGLFPTWYESLSQ